MPMQQVYVITAPTVNYFYADINRPFHKNTNVYSDSTFASLNSQLDVLSHWSRKTGLKENNIYNKHTDLIISLYDGPYNVLLTLIPEQLLSYNSDLFGYLMT